MNSQMSFIALTFLAALAMAVGEPDPSAAKMVTQQRREGPPPRENPAVQAPPRPDTNTNELANEPNSNEDMNADSTFILGLGGWGGGYYGGGWGGWGGWGNRYPYYGGYYNYRPYNNYYGGGGWYNRPYGAYGGWGGWGW